MTAAGNSCSVLNGDIKMAYKTVYPYTGETLKEYAYNTKEDLEEALSERRQQHLQMTPYGPGSAACFSAPDHAYRVAEQIGTGTAFINSGSTTLPEIPFGGVRNPGYGRGLADPASMAL